MQANLGDNEVDLSLLLLLLLIALNAVQNLLDSGGVERQRGGRAACVEQMVLVPRQERQESLKQCCRPQLKESFKSSDRRHQPEAAPRECIGSTGTIGTRKGIT